MPDPLILHLEDYQSDAEWRWRLTDAAGRFLADHDVALDTAHGNHRAWLDLPRYLGEYRPAYTEDELLDGLGAWLGEQLFAGLEPALLAREAHPARVVQVRVPPEAQRLLFRPFELAHLGGVPLARRGLRFVYTLAPAPQPASPQKRDAIQDALRFLAVFSLRYDANPLNLRRERYELKRLSTRSPRCAALLLTSASSSSGPRGGPWRTRSKKRPAGTSSTSPGTDSKASWS